MFYEQLLKEASHEKIDIYEKPMPKNIKGLYAESVIWINCYVESEVEKACILAEELGHYHTSTGNILDQKQLSNRKQEKTARNWAYAKLVPLQKIIDAYTKGIKNYHELAEYLGVTEAFLADSLSRYKEKHGIHTSVGSYQIHFEPLNISKKI